MTIVGDAVLRPLLMQLDEARYDLSSFFAVGNGGAPLTPAVRAMALARLPNLVISDSAGSSETGAQMHVRRVDDVEVGVVPARARAPWWSTSADRGARAGPRGQRVAGPDRQRAARVSRRPGQDGAHLPGDRRRPLLHPRRPGPPPGRRPDRAAGPGLGDRQLRRREDLRRGGRAGHRRAPRRGRRRRHRPAQERWGQEVVAVVQLAEGATTDGRRRSSSTPRPTSPATSCPRRWCSWSRSSARPRARPTTAGRPRPLKAPRGPEPWRPRPTAVVRTGGSCCGRSPTWTGRPSPH